MKLDHQLIRDYLPKLLLIVLLVCVCSGVMSFVLEASDFSFSVALLHSFSGIFCGLMFLVYLFSRPLRALAARGDPLLFSGALAGLTFGVSAVAGLGIIYLGSSGPLAWLYSGHLLVSFIFCTVFFTYITLNTVRFVGNGRSVFKAPSKIFLIAVVATCFFSIIASYAIFKLIDTSYQRQKTVFPVNYEYVYGDNPFRPSQIETPGSNFIHKYDIAKSFECATCHSDIVEQWASSAHRLAAMDPAYITNVKLYKARTSVAATRYCDGCHVPVALLTGAVTTGGKHGRKAKIAANEGVSCKTCHSITDVVHTHGVASFFFSPAQHYPFETTTHSVLKGVRNFLIKTNPDKHKESFGNEVLGESSMCSTCHAQYMDKDVNQWGWVKMQDDYSPWLSSPHANPQGEGHESKKVTRCQDCHMRKVVANDPSADSNGMVRDHRFIGSNTMLPILRDDKVQLDKTIKFLKNNKMEVAILKPLEQPVNKSTKISAPAQLSAGTKPAQNAVLQGAHIAPHLYSGEEAALRIQVTNTGVGHNFPGGTSDITQAWLHVTVTDASGNTVFESGKVDEFEYVDPDAHFYRTIPIDKHNMPVWQHDLLRKVGEVSRTTIAAGKSDIAEFTFVVPDLVRGDITITAALNYRKLNTRYARWALKDKYVPLPITEMARDELSVSVRPTLTPVKN